LNAQYKRLAAGEYLGDGVYASHDGYQIWLAANHHENKVIALEPAVMSALLRYAKAIEAAAYAAPEQPASYSTVAQTDP
jgi:hypothetical protein